MGNRRFVATILITCFGLATIFFSISRASMNNEGLSVAGSQLFPQQADRIGQVPQMIGNAKSAGAGFERRELFQAGAQRIAGDAQFSRILCWRCNSPLQASQEAASVTMGMLSATFLRPMRMCLPIRGRSAALRTRPDMFSALSTRTPASGTGTTHRLTAAAPPLAILTREDHAAQLRFQRLAR